MWDRNDHPFAGATKRTKIVPACDWTVIGQPFTRITCQQPTSLFFLLGLYRQAKDLESGGVILYLSPQHLNASGKGEKRHLKVCSSTTFRAVVDDWYSIKRIKKRKRKQKPITPNDSCRNYPWFNLTVRLKPSWAILDESLKVQGLRVTAADGFSLSKGHHIGHSTGHCGENP